MASSIRVLHVDDDASFGALVADYLEQTDEAVSVATETAAEDALDRLLDGDEAPDGVVSDYDMPNMDGIEFLESVRESYPDLPFVLFTGKGSEEVASEAISKGATDYLQKGGGTEQYELLANRVRNAVEQYRSEQAADRTRRRLQNLAESTSDCVWMFDRDWEELLFISGYEDVWGRPADEIREDPRDFLNGVEPDDRALVRDAMADLSSGDPIDIEYRIRRGDGELGWVWVKGEPVFDDDGGVKSVVGFTRDVTERKYREQRLERHEQLVENLPVGVFRTTPDGDLVSTNEAFASLYGTDSTADADDLRVADLYADQADREALLDEVEREGSVEDRRIEMETAAGETKWVEATLQLSAEDGDRYLDGIVRDVTDRRERSRRLEQAETMFENAQDALFLVDVTGTDGDEQFVVERVNPAYEDATGLSGEDVVGRTPRAVFGDDEGARIERKFRECVASRSTLAYEEMLSIPGGGTTRWETRIAPVAIDGEVEELVGATRDVTDRRERERELRRAERRFEALFDDPNILVGLTDAAGTVLDVNDTAMRYVDADLEAVVGRPLWETPLFAGGESAAAAAREWVSRAADGEYVEFELDLSSAPPVDGELVVSGVVRPVLDGDAGDEAEVASLLLSGRKVTGRARGGDRQERRGERFE